MSLFELSWNGVILCLDTPEARAWQNNYIPLPSTHITNPPTVNKTNLLGLTTPIKQTERNPVRVGEITYPTGASRWMELNLLITETEKNQLTVGGIGTLRLLQDGGSIIIQDVYLISLRPLSPFTPALYLATFVDDRYFFQYSNANNLTITETSDWTTLINNLAGILNIAINFVSPIEAVYAQPHPQSDLTSRFENVAFLLDACLMNVGRVLVRNLDGSYTAQRPEEANATVTANLAASGTPLAGGNGLLAILPKQVTVSFPQRNISDGTYVNPQDGEKNNPHHVPYLRSQGDCSSITVPLAGGVAGTKTMHTTAEAWVAGIVQNQGLVSALAQQLATDYFGWASDTLDVVYSFYLWSPEGQHDICWYWSEGRCNTRVMRSPYNAGFEEFMHHFLAPPVSSSSASSSSSSSASASSASAAPGNGAVVVQQTTCLPNAGLQVNRVTLTGFVIVNGVQVPVNFNTTPFD